MFAAILDTCALWPSAQRDVLLSWAAEGLYRPLWSSAILAELEYHETTKWIAREAPPNEARRRAHSLVATMTSAFDDACVTGWEPLEGAYGLPDPNDEHLVAAAVVSGAGAIVSDNTRDLPGDLIPAGIHVLTTAQFAADTVSLAPSLALVAVRTMVGRYLAPPRTVDEVLTHLQVKNGWADAVAQLRAVDDPTLD